jgi:hypothetical protein
MTRSAAFDYSAFDYLANMYAYQFSFRRDAANELPVDAPDARERGDAFAFRDLIIKETG